MLWFTVNCVKLRIPLNVPSTPILESLCDGCEFSSRSRLSNSSKIPVIWLQLSHYSRNLRIWEMQHRISILKLALQISIDGWSCTWSARSLKIRWRMLRLFLIFHSSCFEIIWSGTTRWPKMVWRSSTGGGESVVNAESFSVAAFVSEDSDGL